MVSVSVVVVALVFGVTWGVRALGGRDITVGGFVWLRGVATRLSAASSAAVQGWRGTHREQELEETVRTLERETAVLADVFEENAFLRSVAELPVRREHRTVLGHVYAAGAVGQRRQALVDVGSRDGIVPGSAAALQDGTLLGIVAEVYERSSRVLLMGDPTTQVTARVLGRDSSGLAHVDQSGQLVLDFVPKDRQVTEGNRIVTSGIDGLPVGLVIGTVRSVDIDHTSLFQRIRIESAHDDGPVWRVVIFES